MDKDLIHQTQFREATTLVGGYLLAWGQLETAFASGFHNVAPHRRGPHINPDDVSRTLKHLTQEWAKEIKKLLPHSAQELDELVSEISAAAGDRNTICHGFQGVFTHFEGEFQIACWHKFHEVRSTGAFPQQRIYERTLLTAMIAETVTYRKRVTGLTQLAQIARDKARGPVESIFRQTLDRPE